MLIAIPAAGADLATRANAFIAPYADSNNFSGSVFVRRGNAILLQNPVGLANVEHGSPVTVNTRFYIASLSKMFTAAAILQLRDDGTLSLNDSASRFIADFPRGDTISIRQLLTHRSGLAQDTSRPDYLSTASRAYTLQEAVALIAKAPRASEPGERRMYANPNYVLLARIVERASGETYAGYLRKHLFQPLGMNATGLHESWLAVVPDRAQGYSPVGVRDLYNAAHYDYSIGTGAGSAWSTAADLDRWIAGLRAGTVLKKESVDEMFGWSGSEGYVGNSLEIGKHHAVKLTGWDGVGFTSALVYAPQDDLVTVVLSNRNVPGVTTTLAETLAQLAEGEPVAEPIQLSSKALDSDLVRRFTGRYRLGSDFFVPGTTLDLVACGDGLCERQSDGRLVAILRTASGDFIHRSSWGTVKFEVAPDGSVTGLEFLGRFHAVKIE